MDDKKSTLASRLLNFLVDKMLSSSVIEGRLNGKLSAEVEERVTRLRKELALPDGFGQGIGNNFTEDFAFEQMSLRSHHKPADFDISGVTVDKKVLENFDSFAMGKDSGYLSKPEQTLSELWLMQRAARIKYNRDPHATSIIDNWTNFTIGSGIKVLVDNDKAQEVIRAFRYANQMAHKEKEFVKYGYMFGEVFIMYFENTKEGTLLIRRVPSENITDIETHPHDLQTIFSYEFKYPKYTTSSAVKMSYETEYIADIDYREYQEKWMGSLDGQKSSKTLKPNKYVQFVKFGFDDELRGRVPMEPVLPFLKYYSDWLIDRMRLNHERSKVVWIKEVKGRSKEGDKRDMRSPRGGTVLIENDNVRYRIESAKLESGDAKEDGLALLHYIGAGTNLPLHILNQRTDQAVYASIRKADTPFSQFIKGKQEHWAYAFEHMYREVIQAAVRARKLPKKIKIKSYSQEAIVNAFERVNALYIEGKSTQDIIEEVKSLLEPAYTEISIRTEDIPISIQFPEIIKEDPKAQAEVMRIHKELGIASRATLASRAGYNWAEELVNLLKERETFGIDTAPKKEDPGKEEPDDDDKEEPGDDDKDDDKDKPGSLPDKEDDED